MSTNHIVAVSQRVDFLPKRNERRDALDQNLVRFLIELDCIPVPVPNSLIIENTDGEISTDFVFTWLNQLNPRVIVLSGGNNIGECRERDITEDCLLQYAQRGAKPVLGICRGMQMMGVWSGANLVPITGHVNKRHRLQSENEQARIPLEVNSYHDLTLASCPAEFEVIANSEDGAIEAIRHIRLPWEGWMWHPERESQTSASDLSRASKLFGGHATS